MLKLFQAIGWRLLLFIEIGGFHCHRITYSRASMDKSVRLCFRRNSVSADDQTPFFRLALPPNALLIRPKQWYRFNSVLPEEWKALDFGRRDVGKNIQCQLVQASTQGSRRRSARRTATGFCSFDRPG